MSQAIGFIPGVSVDVPAIGLGTWPMTGTDCTRAVAQALGLGYRHVDTAENYGNEDAVGRGLRESGVPREELFITSKFNARWHSVVGVREAFGQAATRLGVDYLDAFLVHWPNPGAGNHVAACEGLAELCREGLIRSWGTSNFTPAHLRAVQAAGLAVPLNQIQLDPACQQPGVQDFHRAHSIITAAYSPLGRGGDFLNAPEVVAAAHGHGRTPAQVALRWHVQSGRIAIPKSADATRQRENLAVFDFELTPEQMVGIDLLDTGAGPRLDPDSFGH